MKSVIKIICITVFSVFLVFQMAPAEETTLTETTVGIGQLMSNADQYPDNIMIQGIVSKVFPQDNLIGLIDSPNTPKCDVKTCTKKCPRASAKKCPMAADKSCTKACPMASSQECPMKAAKDCPKASAKGCTKPCPKSAAKTCSMTDAKTCGDSGYTMTLAVQWDGDMPEPSSDVRVVGKITHKDGRLLFVAESVKVMSN